MYSDMMIFQVFNRMFFVKTLLFYRNSDSRRLSSNFDQMKLDATEERELCFEGGDDNLVLVSSLLQVLLCPAVWNQVIVQCPRMWLATHLRRCQ